MTIHRAITKREDIFPDLWSLILSAVAILLLTTLILWMLATQYLFSAVRQTVDDPLGVSQIEFAEETGTQIVRVNVALGGGAVAIRYQVIDPDKAVIIHDERYPPTVVNEETGQILNIPWHEHSHDRDLHTGIIYFELIKNSGGALKPGNKVSVIIGESRLEHVVVQ